MSSAACPPIAVDKPVATGHRALLIDSAEHLFVLGLYSWMVARMMRGALAIDRIGDLLLLVGEGLVVVFFLIRRRTTEISESLTEWIVAGGATCLPLLVTPGGQGVWTPTAVTSVMAAGLILQFYAKLTLARSFGMIPANRGLKTSGPYRFVRHPMYSGYLLMQLGFLALNPTWWNFSVYFVCHSLQIQRMIAEEQFLSRDPVYRDYKSRVAYRLLPGFF